MSSSISPYPVFGKSQNSNVHIGPEQTVPGYLLLDEFMVSVLQGPELSFESRGTFFCIRGNNDFANLQLLSSPCRRKKSTQSIEPRTHNRIEEERGGMNA